MTVEGSPDQLAYPGVKFKKVTKTKGKYGKEEVVFEALPTAQMISEYVDNYIPLVDYAELERFFPLWRSIAGTKKSAKRQFIEGSTEEERLFEVNESVRNLIKNLEGATAKKQEKENGEQNEVK